MKKFLVLLVTIISSTNWAFAGQIVELAAPRAQTPVVMSDDGSKPKSAVTAKKTSIAAKKSKKNVAKKIRKKIIVKKPKPIVVNYGKVAKMIEYGYYDDADAILKGAMSRNPKDVKAQELWMISLAKQCKLDPAQDSLDKLLKMYPDNSNLHYAQGIVYYQRAGSSNMFYRSNASTLMASAANEFKKATALDKNNAMAYNAAGVIAINSGNKKDAKSYFQKAIDADKTYSLAYDNLGTIDYLDGKYKEAGAKFQQALSFNSQNSTAMYHLAQVGVQNKDYKKALCYLNNALAINSNSPAIYNLMGKCYRAQGNEPAAINAFKKSVMVRPEFTLSYLDLADIYDKRGDGEFAIEQLKTAVAIDPTCYDAKLKIGDISVTNGKYDQAIAVYSELVGVGGYNDQALIGLSNAYYGKAQVASSKASLGSNKDLCSAIDYINKAIEVSPRNLELHLAKLKLAKITNQPELSQVELNNIILSTGSDLISTVIKGEAYSTLNDYKNASKMFDSAIDLSKNADDDSYLSEIFIYHKQYASAEKVLRKILQANPQNSQALDNLDYIQKCKKYAANYYKSAQNFLKSKNYPSAIEYLSKSLAMDPNNAQANLLLANLYEKQKNSKDALKAYKAYQGLEPGGPNARRIKKKIKKLDNQL